MIWWYQDHQGYGNWIHSPPLHFGGYSATLDSCMTKISWIPAGLGGWMGVDKGQGRWLTTLARLLQAFYHNLDPKITTVALNSLASSTQKHCCWAALCTACFLLASSQTHNSSFFPLDGFKRATQRTCPRRIQWLWFWGFPSRTRKHRNISGTTSFNCQVSL